MPLEDDEDRLDAFYDDEPLRYRTVTNIISDGSPPRLASLLFAQLHLIHAGEPSTYTEVQGDPAWLAAVQQESSSTYQSATAQSP